MSYRCTSVKPLDDVHALLPRVPVKLKSHTKFSPLLSCNSKVQKCQQLVPDQLTRLVSILSKSKKFVQLQKLKNFNKMHKAYFGDMVTDRLQMDARTTALSPWTQSSTAKNLYRKKNSFHFFSILNHELIKLTKRFQGVVNCRSRIGIFPRSTLKNF